MPRYLKKRIVQLSRFFDEIKKPSENTYKRIARVLENVSLVSFGGSFFQTNDMIARAGTSLLITYDLVTESSRRAKDKEYGFVKYDSDTLETLAFASAGTIPLLKGALTGPDVYGMTLSAACYTKMLSTIFHGLANQKQNEKKFPS